MVCKKEKDEADKTECYPHLERMFKMMQFLSRTNLIDEDEEYTEEDYNVSVYQVLPYPPNTKDVKDFFIQRT